MRAPPSQAPAVTPTATDSELVAQAMSGDNLAFSRLYNQHADYVFALLGRLVGPVPERDDLLQEVFVQLFRALTTFRGDSSVRTFISRIAVNRAHDHLRTRRRRRESLYDDLEAIPIADAKSRGVRDASMVMSDRRTVLRCLERITPKKRVAFVLRVACEMSYGEIAELLEVKPDTARLRVSHARRELSRMLAKEGISS